MTLRFPTLPLPLVNLLLLVTATTISSTFAASDCWRVVSLHKDMIFGERPLYKTLGVCSDASVDEINKAFRRLSKEWHPDISTKPNTVKVYTEIIKAKTVLLQTKERACYDFFGQTSEGMLNLTRAAASDLHKRSFLDEIDPKSPIRQLVDVVLTAILRVVSIVVLEVIVVRAAIVFVVVGGFIVLARM